MLKKVTKITIVTLAVASLALPVTFASAAQLQEGPIIPMYMTNTLFIHTGQIWRVNYNTKVRGFGSSTETDYWYLLPDSIVTIPTGQIVDGRVNTNHGWIPVSDFGSMTLIADSGS